MTLKNPGPAYNFRLDIDGTLAGVFTHVTPPAMRVNTIEYREGGGAPASRVLPGRVVYEPCTLRWGLGLSDTLWTWLENVGKGQAEYKEIALIMMDSTGNTPTVRYEMRRSLPSAWYMSDLDATGHEFAIESLELRYEQLVREIQAQETKESE